MTARPAASRSSRAWARAVSDSSIPANIRDSSRSRPAASSRVSPEVVTEPSLAFSTTTWRSAYAATWGRWVTTRTCADLGQPREPAADLDRGLAADPAVDLVEDERRHRAGAGQGDLEGQHHPRQLTAGRALVERARLAPGVGGEQELDLVDPRRPEPQRPRADREARRRSRVCRTTTSSTAWGIARRSSSPVSSVERRAAVEVRASDSAGCRAAEATAQVVTSLAQPADPVVGVVELGQAGGRGLGPGQHLGRGLAVLAGQRGQRRPALRDGGQPRRVGLEAGGVGRDVGGEVGEQVGELGDPVGQLGGGLVVVAYAVEQRARGRHGGQGVGAAVVGRQRGAGRLGRRAEDEEPAAARAVPVPLPTGWEYDSGDYPETLEMALHMADYDELRAEQPKQRESRGELTGIGLSFFTEAVGAGPRKHMDILGLGMADGAELRVHPTGKAVLRISVQSQGQGHETTFAQIVSQELGISPDDIEVVHGDTDQHPVRAGTYGSGRRRSRGRPWPWPARSGTGEAGGGRHAGGVRPTTWSGTRAAGCQG